MGIFRFLNTILVILLLGTVEDFGLELVVLLAWGLDSRSSVLAAELRTVCRFCLKSKLACEVFHGERVNCS